MANEDANVRTYTPRYVERILRSYLDIIYTLEGKGQELFNTALPAEKPSTGPVLESFIRAAPVKTPINSKEKARLLEDLHCAVLDLEQCLPLLHKDDQLLLIRYHIRQDVTLDELAAERQVVSRGSMQKRIYRAVQRLAEKMERGCSN